MYVASINNNLSEQGFSVVNYIDDFQFAISGPINKLDELKSKTSNTIEQIKTISSEIILNLITLNLIS